MRKGSVWHYKNTDITWDHEADAKKIRQMMERYSMSAAQIGRIIGTCELSVYNWAAGIATPRVEFVGRLRSLQNTLDGVTF